LWHFDVTRLTPEVVRAIAEQPKYGEKLEADGKLERRYLVVGGHGAAWIYNLASNEELDHLLAMSPVYNFVDLLGADLGGDGRSLQGGRKEQTMRAAAELRVPNKQI
jgi:muconolactone delta-isomerase